jgi:hypothetical protein
MDCLAVSRSSWADRVWLGAEGGGITFSTWGCCACGVEGVAAELELRQVSPAEAEAGPLGIELIRVFSVGNRVEDGVGGCGEEGTPVGLGKLALPLPIALRAS